ncbi:rho GTPase-activating protein 36 isoform X2 [Syngnathus scovelli]|uniref:rho GTPase-activating protein 36 isoform X2 n=1 Tax=Syngnathus scovelli TaxID=161590 RepID=UPI002110C7B4|nr:rho GTPase-activating protein 36 isoform X2 [Syngnathus scovelli]
MSGSIGRGTRVTLSPDGPEQLASWPSGFCRAPSDMHFYHEGGLTWANMLGQSVRLQPAAIQNLSEVERARLQQVALFHLDQRELHFKISIPREIRKRRKSLRRKFDSFSKEKKERESAPKAFGIPLSQVIANDRAFKRRQDAMKESRRDCLELEASVLRFRAEKRQLLSGNVPAKSVAPAPPHCILDSVGRGQRRGGLSVDSISDLVESQSRLLEALQLSHPAELEPKKSGSGGSSECRSQSKLSLNPVYPQVPRVLERCCGHIESHGLQTVGIFRVGSSKKRVRQLREDFDAGVDIQLDEEHSVHDVAALLKEFLRDMPDPLLTRELYPAFLHANLLRGAEQLHYLQHLLYLLPPCNCDTLLRLLTFLHTVHSFAQDSVGTNDEEIPGNKMTAANLAVIFGPNLLQRERGGDAGPQAVGIEDSTAIINVTLVLMQNYRKLFMVSAELQQEVLVSLIQTDPDIIDYLLRRKLSNVTEESDVGSGGRRDTGTSLDSVGASSGSLSPMEPRSSLEGGLSSEVFLSVLKMNQSRKQHDNRYGEIRPGKSIRHMRQFHSHHNLLSLAQPTLCRVSSPSSRQHPPADAGNVWVKQAPPEEGKSSFWDFFTGKGSSSETLV